MSDFDFQNPDYDAIFKDRIKCITNLRAHPENLDGVKAFYADDPIQFIYDFGMTFDPRNVEIGLPAYIPFIMFDKQEEFIEWLLAKWKGRVDGVVEKTRDMGATWLCVAFAVWMWLFHPGVVIGFGSRKEELVDKIGDPKSIFWKIRIFIQYLPKELKPKNWNEKADAPFMRVINRENGSAIIGEAGDNIGRGNRTSVYFKDEAAHYEHPDAIDAALSQTSNCKIDVSTPNGTGNPFYRKTHEGRIDKFIFDWRDDPRKNQAWYDKQVATLDPATVAQEIDRDYESSISNSLIDGDIVRKAMARGAADVRPVGRLRVGVDVARFGNDKSVITFRKGRLLIKQIALSKMDVAHVAGQVKIEIKRFGETPEQIAVDTIGIGAGVADMLRAWYPDGIDNKTNKKTQLVADVNCAIRLSDGDNYNIRARMWSDMRDWLETGSIPNDPDLQTDLTALRYGFKGGELLLESKDAAKKRGVHSPDRGDSLALTFAIPTIRKARARPPVMRRQRATVPGMGI